LSLFDSLEDSYYHWQQAVVVVSIHVSSPLLYLTRHYSVITRTKSQINQHHCVTCTSSINSHHSESVSRPYMDDLLVYDNQAIWLILNINVSPVSVSHVPLYQTMSSVNCRAHAFGCSIIIIHTIRYIIRMPHSRRIVGTAWVTACWGTGNIARDVEKTNEMEQGSICLLVPVSTSTSRRIVEYAPFLLIIQLRHRCQSTI
jgi:hypothetical protein